MIFHVMMIVVCFILAVIRPLYPTALDLVFFQLYGVSGAFVVNYAMWAWAYGITCIIRDVFIFLKIKKEYQ